MKKEPPYDELIDVLRNDWQIEASWDGLRRVWYVGWTDEHVKSCAECAKGLGAYADSLCDPLKAENAKLRERVDELEGLTDGKRYIPQEWYQLATNENAKLRELVSRAWGLFLKHGAVHPCDLLEVDAVRDEMRELGIEVDR